MHAPTPAPRRAPDPTDDGRSLPILTLPPPPLTLPDGWAEAQQHWDEVFETIVATCGVRWVSVTRRDRDGALHCLARNAPAATVFDALEDRLGQGPRHEAVRTGRPASSVTAVTDLRWPRWSRSFTPAGPGCLSRALILPISDGSPRVATLNLYFARGAPDGSHVDQVQLGHRIGDWSI